MQAEWFKEWFDSPYYHILYKDRDYTEAVSFIDNLSNYLKLRKEDSIWDLACGKGRHSLYLNKKGFKVTGTDLSENNIKEALALGNEHLEFYVHDMRQPFRMNYFTHVFNLFTSLGYFERESDTLKVFKNVYTSLRAGGIFVIDFFNAEYVRKIITPFHEKTVEGITFKLNKKIEEKKVVKRIDFSDKDKNYFFEEKVSLLELEDFKEFAFKTGFTLEKVFGNYSLDPYARDTSERLILILKK